MSSRDFGRRAGIAGDSIQIAPREKSIRTPPPAPPPPNISHRRPSHRRAPLRRQPVEPAPMPQTTPATERRQLSSPCSTPPSIAQRKQTQQSVVHSSSSRTSGHASAQTPSIAAGSSLPTSESTASGNIRRISTARARRSSSGASSRNAYGFAFKISCENYDGISVSTARH